MFKVVAFVARALNIKSFSQVQDTGRSFAQAYLGSSPVSLVSRLEIMIDQYVRAPNPSSLSISSRIVQVDVEISST